MPSFDIVSKVDLQEVDNAVNQAIKEVSQRYDFKGTHNEIDLDNLGIIPLMFEHSGWSKTYGGMVSFKSFPKMEGDIVFLSGTKVREMLEAGERPPMEFSRPEVADVLIGAAKNNKLFV